MATGRGERLGIVRREGRVDVAGLVAIRDAFDEIFADLFGSKETWARRKAEMVAGRRWVELLY